MRRITNSLALTADFIAVASFVLWAVTSYTSIGSSIITFLSGLPFPVRLVIVIILEMAIAYSIGALARRLAEGESQALHRLPLKIVILSVVSLLLALASTYNLARLLFANSFDALWKYIVLFVILAGLLWLRGQFVRSHLSTVRRIRGEVLMIQRVIAITCGIVFFAFVVEQGMIR